MILVRAIQDVHLGELLLTSAAGFWLMGTDPVIELAADDEVGRSPTRHALACDAERRERERPPFRVRIWRINSA